MSTTLRRAASRAKTIGHVDGQIPYHFLLAFSFNLADRALKHSSSICSRRSSSIIHPALQKSVPGPRRARRTDRAALIDFRRTRIAEKAYRSRATGSTTEPVGATGNPTADEIDDFAEMKACRDVLAHNGGVVNAVYLDKAERKPVIAVRAIIEPPYFSNAAWSKLVNDGCGVTARLGTP